MDVQGFCKSSLRFTAGCSLFLLMACTVNPLTGQKELTGLMPEQQEAAIGASQHREIVKEYGGEYKNTALQSYVNEIGQKMARESQADRPGVTYHFTVLDSPVVNAFALPGGYVYVTRGLLAIANSEAELAAVLGHEVGHVAARHQASRYSQGVLSSLGATVLSAAIGIPAASQAIGLGTNLYMSSYSRDQETQSDLLGIRYLERSGYDTMAMSNFLKSMQGALTVQSKIEGKEERSFSYFSSHPDTSGRVLTAREQAQKIPNNSKAIIGRDRYMSLMRGLPYGDSAEQGFMRDNTFYHPGIGFALSVPQGGKVDNKPERLVIEGQEGTVLVLDMVGSKGLGRAEDYVQQVWLKGRVGERVEPLSVNGLHAATTGLSVTVNNRPADIRLVAIEWGSDKYVRMQMLMPYGVSSAAVDDLKRMTYSFHQMGTAERKTAKPYQIDLVKAGAGDSVQSLSRRMGVAKMPLELFAAINGITPAMPLTPGQSYKIIR